MASLTGQSGLDSLESPPPFPSGGVGPPSDTPAHRFRRRKAPGPKRGEFCVEGGITISSTLALSYPVPPAPIHTLAVDPIVLLTRLHGAGTPEFPAIAQARQGARRPQ